MDTKTSRLETSIPTKQKTFAYFGIVSRVETAMAKFIEFPDGLGPSTPLFVQCRWLFDANKPGSDTREIAATEPVCLLMMTLGIEPLDLAFLVKIFSVKQV